jgi:NADH:ubiquinone oxidoreductase subunit H
LLQPLLDGFKLILNEKTSSFKNNKNLFWVGPYVIIIIIVFLWLIIPNPFYSFSVKFRVLFFIICLGLSVYSRLLRGWASNSKYSLIGSIRSIAQTISYELTLIFCVLRLFYVITSMNLNQVFYIKFDHFFLIAPIVIIWLINILAECGRAPFDFIEGERELVSGFNTEFSRSGFALLFVGEYGIIIFFSLLRITLFIFIPIFFIIFIVLILSFFLLVRSSYPRFRYDFLIELAWIKLLPLSIFYLSLIFFVIV